MLDILAAVIIEAVAVISPRFKEDTSRRLADARRQNQTKLACHYAVAAEIDAVIDATLIETDRALQQLDIRYRLRLNNHRRRYGLPPV